jgi:hypothetical protein
MSKFFAFELSCLFLEENKEIENEILINLLNHLRNGEYLKGLKETTFSDLFFKCKIFSEIDRI